MKRKRASQWPDHIEKTYSFCTGEEPPRTAIDAVDEALTGGTLYAPHPLLEDQVISPKDVQDYQAFGLIIVLLCAFALFVTVAYMPSLFTGLVMAAVLLSFLAPFGLSVLLMKKVYLGIGLLAFGAVFTVLGALVIVGDLFHVGPGTQVTAGTGVSPYDVLFLFGIPPLFMSRRVFRRKIPIYGLR